MLGPEIETPPLTEDRSVQKEMSTPTPRTGSPRTGGAVSPSELPPDILEEARRRLALLALLYSGTFLVAGGAAHFVIRELGPMNVESGGPVHLGTIAAAVVMGLGVYALARYSKVAPRRLLDLALLFEVVGAFGISMSEYWGIFPPGGAMEFTADLYYMGIPWECVWIVLFPLVAPNTPAKTFLASLGAASTGLAVIALSRAMGATSADVPLSFFAVYFLFSTYICVGIAVVANRFMLSMSSRLQKARDVGSYRLVERLGKGGMGEVWKAEHKMLARPAAIKLIRREACGEDPETRETVLRRFEREARATAALHSCHTVEVYDFGFTEEGSFYYVMELLEGLDLASFVERFGPLPPGRAVRILRQACHSLMEAHAQGLVHRDLKPANIFVSRQGLDVDFVKLLDFGLVKSVAEEGGGGRESLGLTREGIAAGTPSYMAPEAATGKSVVDARADIYALGCVAYWLLTGETLFDGDTPMQVVLRHVQDEPVPPSHRSEFEIPEAVERAVMACLAKNPADRPQSAEELAEMLECCLPEDQVWTRDDAREWWRIHLPASRV